MSDTQAKPVMDTTLKIERDLIAELRKAAEQIAAEGHAGWGNACRDAAQTLASKEAELASREAEIARLREALLEGARRVEALKRDCSADPESPTAIQNSRYMGVSYFLRAALTKQPPKD